MTLADDNRTASTGSALFEENTSFEFVIAVTGPADGWSGWGQVINAPAGAATPNCQMVKAEATTVLV